MKNIPKLIPVAYFKAYKEDGKFVWGDDCVAATNDFEDDCYIGVPVVRLSDALVTTPSVSSTTPPSEGQQGRAADVAVSDLRNDVEEAKAAAYRTGSRRLGALLERVSIAMTTQPASPVAVPEGQPKVAEDVGGWLWSEFMNYCKKRGSHPGDNNDLFAIVGKAREKFATTPSVSSTEAQRPSAVGVSGSLDGMPD